MQKNVRAKFKVESISGGKIVMSTVYEDPTKDTENARFTKATPSGRLELAIDNPDALEQFQVGQEYYADFSAAGSGGQSSDQSRSGQTGTTQGRRT